jgi:hypothetical protein
MGIARLWRGKGMEAKELELMALKRLQLHILLLSFTNA